MFGAPTWVGDKLGVSLLVLVAGRRVNRAASAFSEFRSAESVGVRAGLGLVWVMILAPRGSTSKFTFTEETQTSRFGEPGARCFFTDFSFSRSPRSCSYERVWVKDSGSTTSFHIS